VFLEPEGLDTHELYVNGLSTSLPVSVQLEFLRARAGSRAGEDDPAGLCDRVRLLSPTQLTPWLETKVVEHLFFAGK